MYRGHCGKGTAYLNQRETFEKKTDTNKHLWLPVSQSGRDSDMIQESKLNIGIRVFYLQGTAENWNGLTRQNDPANCFVLVHAQNKYIIYYIYIFMYTYSIFILA